LMYRYKTTMKQVVQYDLCTFVLVEFTVAFFAHTFTV
jgi:hypothetical protein